MLAKVARAVALLVMLLGIACTASKVDPDARIALRGSLATQDGSPAGGLRVALVREPDVGEIFSTFVTLGLACLSAGELPDACDGARITTSAEDGRFGYDLLGRDTQGSARNASVMELSTRLPRRGEQLEGPAITFAFLVQTERVRLPLRFWEPHVTARGDARTVRVGWSRLPADVLSPAMSLADTSFDVRFDTPQGTAWVFRHASSGRSLDARLLEDSRGSLSVVARATSVEVPEDLGTEVRFRLASARVPYAALAGPPDSRGKPCYSYAGKRPIAQASCRLTDGDFATEFDPEVCASGRCTPTQASAAYVDLGRARRIALVAARGCEAPCHVETSTDARRWTFAGSGGLRADDDVAIRLDQRPTARYVRVLGAIDRLREVSVWAAGRPRAGVPRSLIVRPGTPGTGEPVREGGARSGILRWVLVALAAVGVAGGAYALGMRAARSSAHT